jgi:hypothetical protein
MTKGSDTSLFNLVLSTFVVVYKTPNVELSDNWGQRWYRLYQTSHKVKAVIATILVT